MFVIRIKVFFVFSARVCTTWTLSPRRWWPMQPRAATLLPSRPHTPRLGSQPVPPHRLNHYFLNYVFASSALWSSSPHELFLLQESWDMSCTVIVNDISDLLSSNTTMGNQQSGAGGGGGKDKVKICSAIFPEKLPGLKVIWNWRVNIIDGTQRP